MGKFVKKLGCILMKKELDMGKEKFIKLLLTFSVPCVISLLVRALYNIVDQIFIGQSVGYLDNAATNVVYPFTVIALAVSLLIGDGTTALFSLSLGKKDNKTANKCVGNSIIISFLLGIIITLIGVIFKEGMLSLFGVTKNTYGYAKDYLNIILIGMPFYVVVNTLNSVIRADNSSKYAMFATLIGALLNIILDPIFIFVFNTGVKGAALATIISQIISCFFTLIYFKKTKIISLSKESMKFDLGITKKVASLGVSSFITQISIVIIAALANNLMVKYGIDSKFGANIPLSAFGIVMKVFGIVVSIFVGVSVGGQPIIGYNYGAGNIKRVKETHKLIILINIIVRLIATIIFEFFPQSIIKIFGSESALYNEYAVLCFRIYLGTILLCSVTKSTGIFLQSIGSSVKAMILSVARDVVFIGTAMIILASIYGVVGLLFSAIIADILTFILTIWFTLEFYHKAKERNAYSTSLESIGDGKTIINNHIVITISREYGSGGRYVGQLLAKKLGINFYDKELIKLIAKDTGFTENYIENNIESSTSLNSFYNNDDKMFASETKIVKNLAKKES